MLIVGVVVLFAIGVAIVGAFSSERPAFRTIGVAVASLVAIVVLLPLATLLLRGRGAEDDEPADVPAQPTETRPQPASSEPVLRRPVDLVIGTVGKDLGFRAASAVLDDLPENETRLIGVATSGPAILRECVVGGPAAPRSCAVGTPAGTIEGLAVGLVELRRVIAVPSGPVDCAVRRCELVATTPNGRRDLASVPLVFGRAAPVPTLRIRSARDARPGSRVNVVVAGLSPREAVTLTWCVPPGPVEPDACGGPAPEVRLHADSKGVAVGTLRVPTGSVGTGRTGCGPRSRCAIAVIGAIVSPVPAEVRFAGVPGPDLPGGQLAGGLAAAFVLAVVAAWLFRRRPDEHPEDPFWGVSLEVPEWEGVDLTVDPDEWIDVADRTKVSR